MESSNNNNNNNENESIPRPPPPLGGRVVRLHFRCHAEIPIGSFLRVTGSTLWAPGTPATDPSDAAHVSSHVDQETASRAAMFDASGNGAGASKDTPADELLVPSAGALYASSVEMVTTPEEYPIWKTRKPVIVTVHSHRSNKTVQHHYYRYLVVSPGGNVNMLNNPSLASVNNNNNASTGPNPAANGGEDADDAFLVSTSSEMTGSTTVMQWEDPFFTLARQHPHQQQQQQQQGGGGGMRGAGGSSSGVASASASAVSLTSTVTLAAGQTTSMDYRNLPYRTLDIDIQTARPLYNDTPDDALGTEEGPSKAMDEEQSIRLDRWNMPDDASFQPYLIREAINEENRRKLQPRLSDVTDVSETMDVTEDDRGEDKGHSTPPVAFDGKTTNRIFFVCFHLPVVVVKNPTTGEWQASWSESILAKTEGSQILSTYQAHWVGTVTTHPPLQTEEDKNEVRALLQGMDCTPIFLDPNTRQAHYYGFCKQVLWPAFHNIDLLDMSTSGWLYYDPSKPYQPSTGSQQQQQQQQQAGDTNNPTGIATDPVDEQSDWDQSRLEDWWNAFQGVNEVFKDLMVKLLRSGDIVWIHDYHLALLPLKLTAWETETFGVKVTRKVFFLHIPFPTSQIFRELECGEKILQGMLHADVVGFHAFDHARHFLNAAKRILGLSYESLVGGLIGVTFQGSTVLVSMNNVSIEPRKVDAVLKLPSVEKGKNELRDRHSGKMIIGALDIAQRLSGASLKLLAYERLLQDYPVWQHRVVMVQRMLIPGSRKADEAVTIREIRALVKRIQNKFGFDVIEYQELVGSTLPMDQRLAFWKGSDILMSTPIREGLNHWPMEFIYAHKEPETPGVVIASEFSAISSILNGALRVNPYDIQATVATIDKALSMDQQEREGRRYRDIDFVSASPSDKWVKNVLRDLRDATARRQTSSSSSGASEANSQMSTPYATPSRSRKLNVDSTAAFLARETDQAFGHLNAKTLKRAYDACKRRLIVLDFNGTIVLKEPPGKYLKREILGTSGNKPPPEVVEALAKLSEDPNNLVYVVSGDSSENVLSALGHLPGVGLAVSNGARFTPPLINTGGPQTISAIGVGAGINQRRWLTFDLGVDWDAVKRVALPVLSKYTARSNGSFVKLTSFSIGWSYYSCDPEWGSLQAAHLVLELESELRAFDVRFVTLKGIVEIVPRKLNKGLIVKKVLRDCTSHYPDSPVELVLCFGDDISDEKMFTSVFTFLAEQGDEVNSKPVPVVLGDDGTLIADTRMNRNTKIPDLQYCYTVAVGKKPSHANFYVNDAQEVANCLIMLAKGEIPEGGLQIWDSMSTSNLFS